MRRHRRPETSPTQNPGGNPPPMLTPCVYIMANRTRGALYVGATADLPERVRQHRHHAFDGYDVANLVHTLVWYESHPLLSDAFSRMWDIIELPRSQKIDLVEQQNPRWRDLSPQLPAPAQGDSPLRYLRLDLWPS